MKILGLDISSVSTGWALIQDDPLELLDSGVIVCDPKQSLGEKLLHLDFELTVILAINEEIDWIGIEDTYNNNTITMKTLSKFAGVAIKCLEEAYNIGVTYSDSTIERALKRRRGKPESGIFITAPTAINKLIGLEHRLDRSQRKSMIVQKVNEIFGAQFTEADNDETDAIAVALAVSKKISHSGVS